VLPHHPLDEVKRICEEADILLDRVRCIDMLTPYIDLFRCKPFARDVVATLTLDDFVKPVKIGGVPYDLYGVRLTKDLKQRYGIEQLGNFYVKLRIARPGKLVFFISLHEMERELWRRGGLLRPKESN
jgi:hypothetical protein